MKLIFASALFVCVAWSNLFAQTVVTPPFPAPGATCTVADADLNYVVNGNIQWTVGAYEVNRTIRIPNGSTFNINGGTVLHFVPGVEIIVERGGVLNIDGANTELTSDCRANGANSKLFRWEGINVRGTSNSANASDQGKVVITNGATISNAKVAIEQVGGCLDYGGGIIQADDANFINNTCAALFTDYDLNTSSSWFRDCLFQIDEDYMEFALLSEALPTSGKREWRIWNGDDTDPQSGQIILRNNMDGVQVTNCDFLNYFSANALGEATSSPSWTYTVPGPSGTTTTIPWPSSTTLWADPFYQSSAIHATESRIGVDANNLCSDETGTDRNEFVGWYHGVYVFFSNYATVDINIEGSIFTDNKHGIYVSHPENLTIEDNFFNVGWDVASSPNRGVFNRFRMQNEDGVNGPSAANIYAAYVRERIDNFVFVDNRIDVDLDVNFGGFTGLMYYAASGHFPFTFRIQKNTFNGVVTHHAASYQQATVQTVVRLFGIVLFNIGQGTDATHHLYMDCNEFDFRNPSPTFNTNKHYERLDILFTKASGNSPTVTVESLHNYGSAPMTTWTDFTGQTCGAHSSGVFVNYRAYNIESDFPVTYPTYNGAGTLTDYPNCVNTTHVTRSTVTAPTNSCPGICGTMATEPPQTPPMESETSNHREWSNETLKVFPNPASEMLNVETESTGNVRVTGLDGREVLSVRAMDSGKSQIDISQLAPGEYILHFTSEKGAHTTKFRKE